MIDLKFDKRDLDMILDCLNDLQYESCKEAVRDSNYQGTVGVAADIHGLMFMNRQKKEHYIELYMSANPNQKDYFYCPKCKRILNVFEDWKFKDEEKKVIFGPNVGKPETILYCKDCGWTEEEAPFEEEKLGGNQAE